MAMTQDASGNIIVAGFGGSQSMVVARFTAAGVFNASAVCYAPHLIDYTARALALRPNGSIVLVGYGRDRHASAAVPPTGPAVLYGLRAIVTLPASGNSTTACGAYSSNGGLSLGSAGVTVDGLNHDGTGADPAWAGRFYDAVVALPDNRYVVGTRTARAAPPGCSATAPRAPSTTRSAAAAWSARERGARARAARRRLGARGRRVRSTRPSSANRTCRSRASRDAARVGRVRHRRRRALARRRRQQHRARRSSCRATAA